MIKKKLVAIIALFLAFPIVTRSALIETELTYKVRNAKGVYSYAPFLPGIGGVNLANGNLVFSRSLVTRPGRAGFNADISLVYNSKIWDRVGNVMTIPEAGSWVGLGWRIGFPKLVQGSSSYAVVFSDGSSHEIVDLGSGVWRSVDSTYIMFNPTTKTATLKGGVKLIFGNTIGATSYMTLMKDRNGNQISASYLPGTGKLSTVYDSVEILASFTYGTDGMLQSITSYGTSRATTNFSYATYTPNPSFSIPWQVSQSEKLLTEVAFVTPTDTLKIVFAYDAYQGFGELTGITNVVHVSGYADESDTLGTLGYGTMPFWDSTYGSVEERVFRGWTKYVTEVDKFGTHYYVTSSRNIDYSVDQTKSNPSSVTVRDYGSAYPETDYALHFTSGGRSWSDGLIQNIQRKTSYLQNPQYTLRTEETTWTQDNPSLSLIDNPRVASRKVTLDNGQYTLTNFTYAPDNLGNVRQTSEYGFSGELIRTTATNYLHESNPSYSALNLTSLPSSVSITDGNGNEVSRTEYAYDEYPLTSYGGGIYNHDSSYDSSFTTRGNATSVRRVYKDGTAVAPSATTQAASAVGVTQATLNGAVNPNGIPTTVQFQWGTSTAYSNSTTTQAIGSGTTAVNVSVNLSGLAKAQTYHYRVLAFNAKGMTFGADVAFTTQTDLSVMLSPTPGTTLNSPYQTFTWTAGSATQYWLTVKYLDQYNYQESIFDGSVGTNLSMTFSNLPMSGYPIYVRLKSLIAGTWQWNDYTYQTTDSDLAKITTPQPGTMIPWGGPPYYTTTFNWSAGGGTLFGLLVGTGGAGAADLLYLMWTTSLSATVSNLPQKGGTINVRLYTGIRDSYVFWKDYTYRLGWRSYQPLPPDAGKAVLDGASQNAAAEVAEPIVAAIAAGFQDGPMKVRGRAADSDYKPSQSGGRYGAADTYVTTSTHFDVAGNVVSTTDAKGNTTTVAYSSGTHYAYPATVTNPLGHVTSYTWWTRDSAMNGDLQSVTDPNGIVVSQLSYDYLGRKTQETTPTGTKNFTYDDLNFLSVSSSSTGTGYTTSNPNGDILGTRHNDPSGPDIEESATYDPWGMKQTETTPHRYGGSGTGRSYQYDALGRLTSDYVWAAGTTSYQYSGNVTYVTDADGKTKKYTYNALGKVSKVTEQDDQGNLTLDTTYDYDVMGHLIRVVQGCQTRTFLYDSLGRLVVEAHPESGMTTYTYDENGNMTAKTDGRNVVTTIYYDALNRPTGKTYSDGTPSATFGYDETSSSLIGIITNGKGHQTSSWTSDGIGYSWSFDTSGRPLQQVFRIDGVNYPVTYNYTASGCGCSSADLQSMTYPNGEQVTYTRDSAGRVLSINSPGYVYVQNMTYNAPNGAMTYDGVGGTYSYGSLNQLSRLDVTGGWGMPSATWFYIYSGAGRLTNVAENVNDGKDHASSYAYSYDYLGRLKSATRTFVGATDWALSYSYDRYGNLSGSGADAVTNRIPSLSYDAAGHVIGDGKSYTYNGMGLLTQVNSGTLGNYRYDAMGRRVKRTWNYSDSFGPRLGSIIYVYGMKGEILAEYKNETTSCGTENTVSDNIVRDGQLVARHVTGTQCYGSVDHVHRLLRNHLGQVIGDVASGMGAQCIPVQPYPRPFSSGGSDQFPGQKDDPESGLKDFGARYYNPSMSRWTSPDSIMAHPYDPQSLNKYAYVRNDPVNKVEPDGRLWQTVCFGPGDCKDVWVEGETDTWGWWFRGHQDDFINPPQNMVPKQCDRANEANARVLNFMDEHTEDAKAIAVVANVPYEMILAVSAQETQWGTQGIAVAVDPDGNMTNNFFGLHVCNADDQHHYVNQTGVYKTTGTPPVYVAEFSADSGFLDSGMAFAGTTAGKSIGGMKLIDVNNFATTLHNHGYGTDDANYVRKLSAVLKSIKSRENCP